MLSLAQVEDMFSDMHSNPALNSDGELLWGFFFTDPDQEKLNQAAYELEDLGYRFVKIYPCDGENYFWLHVERQETLTPQLLFERNEFFESFANTHQLRSYDGMDVGPLPPT